MESTRPKPLGDLFAEAVEIEDLAERAVYLDQACAGDLDLRRRLEALLAADAAADAESLPTVSDGQKLPADTDLTGSYVGRYRLLQQIGEGGCGVVFLAEQETPVRRRVALKLIKLGMDTRRVIARFEAERQALAMMDHPNIAKVLDAGTTEEWKAEEGPKSEVFLGTACRLDARDAGREAGSPLPSDGRGVGGEGEGGSNPASPPRPSAPSPQRWPAPAPFRLPAGRPYFVMELVRGLKITEYCDRHGLSTRQRLDLFIQVCHAVQHAHQKGIIHRDLKPSNILVTELDGQPIPKVIDFGIAKAIEGRLTDQPLFTALEQFIGTPAYMSPEQATMTAADVDTRSDIYSLGVLLYELLTGRTPFDQKELLAAGLDAMRRTIQDKEPPCPSTRLTQELMAAGASQRHPATGAGLGFDQTFSPDSRRRLLELIRQLKGDLDWIVMKCLAKERGRRYETANALALDLRRHLDHEPVLARPPSRLYEFQRAVRRHKVGFAATAALILTLAGGVATSTWEAARARRAEQAAQSSASQQRQTAYVAHMKEAGEALSHGELARVRSLLRRYVPAPGEPDLRGWEWRHLAWEARGDPHFSLDGHSNRVACVRFLDNHTLLTVGHADRQTILWNLEERQPVARLTNLVQPTQVAVLPAQHRFYYSYHPPFADTLRVVNWLSRTEAPARFHSPSSFPELCGVVCSGDEQVLAVRSQHRVEVLDLRWDRAVGTVETGEALATAAALSSDGTLLAVGTGDGRLIWWRAAEPASVPGRASNGGSTGACRQVCISPDGAWLAFAAENAIQLWRVQDRSLEHVLPPMAPSGALAFSPNSRFLALGREPSDIALIEVASGNLQRTFRGHTDQVQALDFSPDGRQLASCSRNGEVKVWALDSAAAVPASVPLRFWHSSGFAPDGSAFYTVPSSRREYAEVYSAWTLEPLGRITMSDLHDPVGILLPGGRSAALADGGDGSLRLRGETDRVVPRAQAVGTVELAGSDDGRVLVTHPWAEQHLKVWRLPEVELDRDVPVGPIPGGGYMYFCLAPNGRRLAAATGTGQFDVWTVPDLRRIFSSRYLTPVENTSFAFTPEARWLAVARGDASPTILDLDRLNAPALSLPAPPGCWAMDFSPDGARLAIGAGDGVRLFDSRTGEQLVLLPAPEASALAFTPDGECLTVVTHQQATVFRAPPADRLDFDWLQR